MTREEAIEIIKRNCINGSLMHEACEIFLPELFESEDERIRKRIRLCLEECVHSDIIRDYERSECIAWLERQKENPKSAVPIPSDCVSDAKWANRVLTNAIVALANSVDYNRSEPSIYSKEIDDLKRLREEIERQKEQKPDDGPLDDPKFIKGFDTGREVRRIFDEKKPAEWSEEDKKPFKNVLDGLKYAYEDLTNHKSYDSAKDVKDAYYWMVSRFQNLQPKQEWSEEDKRRVKQLMYDTFHIRAEYEKRKKELGESFNDELIKDCDEQIAWLKSLRPDGYKNCNSRWKPSEGQMVALDGCIEHWQGNTFQKELLESLYNDLKKLL